MNYKKYEVEGVLIKGEGTQNIKSPFKASFVLANQKTEAVARQTIQRKLITGHLRDTVENFKKWHECQLTNVTEATAKEIKEVSMSVDKIDKYSMRELCLLAIQEGASYLPTKAGSVSEARWKLKADIEKGQKVPTSTAKKGAKVEDQDEDEIESVDLNESEEFEKL